MDIIEEHYGKSIFVLYGLFAHVPGKKAWPRKIFVTFSLLMLFLATYIQVLILVIEEFQRRVILEYLPTTVATAGTLIYIPYVIYSTDEAFKVLLSILLNDLTEKRTEEENEIKRKCADNAKLFINVFMFIFGTAMIVIWLSGFIPYFLDLLISLNETRKRRLIIRCESLIDEQTYFYHMYFFECSIVVIIAIAIGVTENMAIIFSQHARSIIAVIGHRLENLTRIEDRKVLESIDFMELVKHRLQGCIKEHQMLLQYVVLIEDFYEFPLILILSGSLCTLTVSLAQATDPQLTNITIVFFTIAQVFQLFIVCYLGQLAIDSTKEISVNAYNSDWHICTPRVRKMLQMTILRSSKPCVLTVRGVFVLSVENFMVVMQTVISFYMVLRQTT